KVSSILLKIRNSLKSTFFLLIFPLLLPEFIFFPALESVIGKLIKLLLIWSIAWLITQLINAIEEVSLIKSEALATTNYHSRSIITKAKICKRVLTLLITVIAVAASFMLFKATRTIGTSVLASAGVITGIVGLAANKTIGNFLTGLQIAFSEPIKINDAVNVEGEFGIVEEISLSYAVIKIWDFRRLIVPINYFVDNHFINYSRNSTDVISSIIFCIDYTIPVAQLREQFETIIANSSFWDGKTVALQVTDIQASTLKLRGIASTKSPGDSWSLRCEVLEKLNNFMVNNYPNSLPKLRIIHEG
ncbi:MAG: mechanosensitive ion channel family protein, partial [Burkholderiales bacterium]